MLKGAMGKRLCYFMSATLRLISFLGLLIAYIVVRITKGQDLPWLNSLLLILTISSIVTGLYNLIMCGMPAIMYKQNFVVQLFCFILTIVSGGIVSTVFTGMAVFQKVDDVDIENEKIINIKSFNVQGGKKDEKEK